MDSIKVLTITEDAITADPMESITRLTITVDITVYSISVDSINVLTVTADPMKTITVNSSTRLTITEDII